MLFLSHSWDDKRSVRRVLEAACTQGFPVWLDEQQVEVGQSIPSAWGLAIKRSKVFLYFASPSALASAAVQDELTLALSLPEVRVVAVKSTPNAPIPKELRDNLYLNLEASNLQGGLTHLLNEISPLLNSPEHTDAVFSGTVRASGQHVTLSWRDIQPSVGSANIGKIALLDDSYDRIDWELSRQLDTTLTEIEAKFSSSENAYAQWDYFRFFGTSVVPEVLRLCDLSIRSDRVDSPEDRFRNALIKAAIRSLVVRMTALTGYLSKFFTDSPMTSSEYEFLQPNDPYPKGTRMDFVSNGASIGALRVPMVDLEYLPNGLSDPQRDMLSHEIGEVIGHRLGLSFGRSNRNPIQIPNLSSIQWGLA